MIARGDAIAGGAIGDTGQRILPGEWTGPVPPLPHSVPQRRGRGRRFTAHK